MFVICFTIDIKANCWFISDRFDAVNGIRHKGDDFSRADRAIATLKQWWEYMGG
jgi:hypothetical protein